jgi:hypothetical protein
VLLNINKRLLEEEMYVKPNLSKRKNKDKNPNWEISRKYTRPDYLKGYQFTVLHEIPCTDSYIIEVEGKDFKGRKIVSKDHVLGYKRIVWDGVILEQEMIKWNKEKKERNEKKNI